MEVFLVLHGYTLYLCGTAAVGIVGTNVKSQCIHINSLFSGTRPIGDIPTKRDLDVSLLGHIVKNKGSQGDSRIILTNDCEVINVRMDTLMVQQHPGFT